MSKITPLLSRSKGRFRIASSGKKWVGISDGTTSYVTLRGDIRACTSLPPFDRNKAIRSREYRKNLNAAAARKALKLTTGRPVNRIDTDFEHYCSQQDLSLDLPNEGWPTVIILLVPAVVGLVSMAYAEETENYWIFVASTLIALVLSSAFAYFFDWNKEARQTFENAQRCYESHRSLEDSASHFTEEWPTLYRRMAKEKWDEYHKRLSLSRLNDLSGLDFEALVAEIYKRKGFDTFQTKRSGDFGVDLIATRGGKKIAIQIKRYRQNVGVSAIQQAASGRDYYDANSAAVVTNSAFTRQAQELAEKIGVELISKDKLHVLWRDANMLLGSPVFSLEEFERLEPSIDAFLAKFH